MSLSKEVREGAPLRERSKVNWNATTSVERHKRLASAIIVAEGFVPQNYSTLEELKNVRKSFNQLLRVVKGDFQERRVLNDMACRDVDRHFDRYPETFVYHSKLWFKKEQAVFPLWCARRDCDMDLAMLHNARDGLWRAIKWREWEIKNERWVQRCAMNTGVRAFSEPRLVRATNDQVDDERPRGRSKSVVGIRGGALFPIDAGRDGRDQRLDTLLLSAKTFLPSSCMTLREINVICRGFNEKLGLVKNDFKARKVLLGMHWKELEERWEQVPEAKVHYSVKWWEKQRAFGPLWGVQRNYDRDFARVVNAKDVLHCALDKRAWEIIEAVRRATEAARRPWSRAYSVPGTSGVSGEKKDDQTPRGRSKSVAGVRGGALSTNDDGDECVEVSGSEEYFSAAEYCNESTSDATSEHFVTTSDCHDDSDHADDSGEYDTASQGASSITGPTRSLHSISSAAETVIPYYTTVAHVDEAIVEARKIFNEQTLAIGAENGSSLRRHEQYLKHFWFSPGDALKLRRLEYDGLRKRLERLNNDYLNEFAALVRRRDEIVAIEAKTTEAQVEIAFAEFEKSDDIRSTVVEVGRSISPPAADTVNLGESVSLLLIRGGDLSLRTDEYQHGIPRNITDLEDTDAIDISLSWPEQPATIRATGYTTVADVDVAIAKARQVLMSGRRAFRTQLIESRSRFAQNQYYTAPTHNYGPARGERFLLFNHHHKQLLALQITFLVKQSVLLRRRNKLLDAEANSAEAPLRGGDLSLRTDNEYQDHPDAIKVFLAWGEETAPGVYSASAQCATVSDISAALTQGRELLWQAIQEIRAQSFWFAQTMRNLIPTKQERDEWCRGHNHYYRQLRFLQSTFLMKQGVLLKKRAKLLNAEANSAGSSLRGGAFEDWSDISPSPTISESSSPDTAADCGEYTIALAEVDEAITGTRERMRAHIVSLGSLNNSALQHVSDLKKERKMNSTQAVFGHWSRLVVHRGYRQQLLELQKRHLLELGKLLMSRNYLIEAWNKGPEFESGPVKRAKRNYSSMAAVEMPQYRALLPAPMPWKVGAPVVVTIRGGGLSSDSGSEDEESKATTVAEVDKAMASAREVLGSLVSDTPAEYLGAGFPPASLIHRRIRLIRRRVWRSRRLRKNRDYHKALVVLRGTERKLHDKTCERLSRLLGLHVGSDLAREEVGKLLEYREREIPAPSEAIRLSRAQVEEKEAAEGRTFDLPIRGGALSSPESSDSDSSQDYNTIAEVEEAIVEARALLREQLSAVESRNFASHVRHAQEERRINDERHIRNFERDEAITRIGDIRDLEKQAYEKEKEHLNRLHKEKEVDLQKRLEDLLALAKAKTEKPPVAPKDSEMEAAVASVADLEDPESISFSPAEPVVKLPGQTKKVGDESPSVAGLRGGAGSVFQEVLEENEKHFLDADLAPSSALSKGLEKATAEHADGVFRVSSSSASPTIRVEQRDGDSWKGERMALLSSGGVSKATKVINNAHVEMKSEDVFNVGSFFSAKEETLQPAELGVASTDWYRPLAEFQYLDHWYEEPLPGINVGSDGAASLVPYSSPVVSDTSTEIEAKREAYNLKESDSDGWCYLTSSGIIGRYGVNDVPPPPVALDHVPGRGFFPRQIEDRPLILPKPAEQRMEDPVLAAFAAAHEQGHKAWKSEPVVNEWADGVSSHENVQDSFPPPFADAEEGYDSIPSRPVGDIITTAVSAKASASEKSVSLTTSAFLRNIRRCARYVKDTVKHGRDSLPLEDEVQYCASPRLLPEDGAFEQDSESDNEPAMKSVFNLTSPPSPHISEELDRKLEASLTESSKAARCKTRTGMGRFRNGKLSIPSLSKHIRNTLPVISKSQKKKYFARKESLSSDDYDSLLEDTDSAMKKEGMSRFVKKWNDYAHTHGFWHTQSDKAAQPPFELLPPTIWKLHLEPPKEVGVDDAFQGGTTAHNLCDSNRFVEDPYDTEDFDRSNLTGIVQRVHQMKKKYWSKEMRARKEREMKEGEDFDSYFKRVYPSVKRAKSELKLSPRVKAEESEDHFSIRKWTGRAPNDVAEGLRGGSLDEDELETSTSLRAILKHGRMSLLADDGLWQSLKRKSKWQDGISFIDAGPPPLEHPTKRQKPYNPAQRSSPLRHQPPIPHFPPSPPRTPPPPPLPTSLEEPAYFWSLPENPPQSKKFDPIRLNADFVPLPRTGDFDKFCGLNTKTLGDMGRTFIAKRRQAGKIRTHKHCLISATHRRDSGCELVEEFAPRSEDGLVKKIGAGESYRPDGMHPAISGPVTHHPHPRFGYRDNRSPMRRGGRSPFRGGRRSPPPRERSPFGNNGDTFRPRNNRSPLRRGSRSPPPNRFNRDRSPPMRRGGWGGSRGGRSPMSSRQRSPISRARSPVSTAGSRARSPIGDGPGARRDNSPPSRARSPLGMRRGFSPRRDRSPIRRDFMEDRENTRRRSRSPFDRNRAQIRQRSPFRQDRERSPPRGPRTGGNPNWRPRSRSPLRPNRFGGPNQWRRRSPSPGSKGTSEGGSRRQSPRRSPPPNRYRPAPGGDLIRDRLPLSDRGRENTRSPFVGNKRDESQGRDTGSINSRSTPRERSRSPVRGRDISPLSRDAPPPRVRSPPPQRARSPIRARSPTPPPRQRSPMREGLQIRGRAGSPPRGPARPAQPFRAPTGPREGQRFGEGRFGFDGARDNGVNRRAGFSERPAFNDRPPFNAGGANAIPVAARSPNPSIGRQGSSASTTASAAPTGPKKDTEMEAGEVGEVGGSVERHKGALVWTSKHLQPSSTPSGSSAPAGSLNASAPSFEPSTNPSTNTTNTNSNANTANTTSSTAPPTAPAKVSPPIAPRGFVPSGPRGGFGGGYRGGRQSFSNDRRPSYTPSNENHNNQHNSGWGAAPAAPRAALGNNTTALNTHNAANAAPPTGPAAQGQAVGSNVTTPSTPKVAMASPSIANPSPSPATTPVQQIPTAPKAPTPTQQTPVAIPTGPRASLSAASGHSRTAPAAIPRTNINDDMDWNSAGPAQTVTPSLVRRESSVSAAASTMSHNANAPVNAPSGPAAQTHNGGWGAAAPAPSGPAAHNGGWGAPHKPNFTAGWGAAASASASTGGWGNTSAAPANGFTSAFPFATAPPRSVVHPALSSLLPIIPSGKVDIAYTGMSREIELRLQKARDEESRLRREVEGKDGELRRCLREWSTLERESRGAGVRSELSGGCLEGLGGGDGLGASRAF